MRRGQRVHVDSKTQKNDKNYDVHVLCSLLRVFVSTYIHVFVF